MIIRTTGWRIIWNTHASRRPRNPPVSFTAIKVVKFTAMVEASRVRNCPIGRFA